MHADSLIARISSPEANTILDRLYGPEGRESQRARWLDLVRGTLEAFPEHAENLRIFSAAGRTELGGNHTDHNLGKVLAASIQLDALAVVGPRDDTTVRLRSPGYPDVVVDIEDSAIRPQEKGTTEALVRGIAACFKEKGIAIRGWTANVHNTVLSGSGLSSSAAIEVLVGAIFNGLYNGGRFDAVEIAKMGQRAENEWFGKPCGLMDQVACAHGGAVAIDFKDPAKPLVEGVSFDPAQDGLALCVVDTGGNHADLTDDYAAIPGEMKAVARALGQENLRGLDEKALIEAAPRLRETCGDRALLRALHFLGENTRVDAMLAALKAGDTTGFLEAVRESGRSSWCLLQNVFTPARPVEQGVSLALALTEQFLAAANAGGHAAPESGIAANGPAIRATANAGGHAVPESGIAANGAAVRATANAGGRNAPPGVCRVHGGGFAGTIQAYIPLDKTDAYRAFMAPVFGEKAVTVLRIRSFGAGEIQI